MIAFDGASLLLQWATGGLMFVWLTTRRRVVSLGYGWLMRGVYGAMAVGAFYVGVFVIEPQWVRDVSSALVALSAFAVLGVSVARRRAGAAGQRALAEHRAARVDAMIGRQRSGEDQPAPTAEFDPRLDLIAPMLGWVGVVAAGVVAGSPVWLSVSRFVVGALFLGVITDAMLLGHWYLVQPGMARAPLLELVRWTQWLTLPEIALLLVPPGMVSVLNGTIDDGYGGLLGWFWVASAVTTVVLVIVTRLALKERQYAAVMAATGLLYLAILTAFGTDLVARALLSR